jgi:toxin YoeB
MDATLSADRLPVVAFKWQAQDRMVLKRINQLIQDVIRNGNEGNGKPEPLEHDFAGYWSRRITSDPARLQDRRRGGQDRCLPRYHYGADLPLTLERVLAKWRYYSHTYDHE